MFSSNNLQEKSLRGDMELSAKRYMDFRILDHSAMTPAMLILSSEHRA